jgi:hypothetical protein
MITLWMDDDASDEDDADSDDDASALKKIQRIGGHDQGGLLPL